MKLLFITPNLENNSLGRTHCLWLLAEQLGYDSTIAAVKGRQPWAPLAGTAFADRCVSFADGRQQILADDPVPDGLLELARQADLVVAVKPVLSSTGTALTVHEQVGTPVLLDIDDPDVEVRTSALPRHEQAARWLLRQAYRDQVRLLPRLSGLPRAVSNPVLQARYGGVIIPHPRPLPVAGEQPTSTEERIERSAETGPVVRFVGSVRPHKGIEELRAAVAQLAGDGFRLEVTAAAPADAQPWERWLGTTTMQVGQRLVETADIIAVPSRVDAWSQAQLPAKLIDAMMADRAVVASDVGPMRWALGGTGLLTPPAQVPGLVTALRRLADPQLRRDLGEAAGRRARQRFSVPAVAPSFAALCEFAEARRA